MPPSGQTTPGAPPDPIPDGSIERYVVTGTAANYAGQLVILVVWFFLTPFILDEIGATQYSLWVIVASVIAYGQLFDLGINDAVAKYTAEHRALGDDETASSLIATALWLFLGLGVAVAIAGYLLAPLVVSAFNIPAAERDTAERLVWVAGIGMAVELPAGTAYSVLRGLHRFDLINLISSLGMLALAGGTVLVLVLGGGVVEMAAIVIPLTLVWQVPAIAMIHRLAPELRFGLRGARRDQVREVASFGGALFGINAAETVKMKSSEIVIGASLPVAAVAPFSVARRLSELPEMLTFQFAKTLMPLSSKLYAEGHRDALRGIYISATRVVLGVFAAAAIPMTVYSSELLTAWVGAEFAADADVLVVLVFAGLAKVAMFPALLMLQGMDRHRPLVVFALSSAALHLVLAISLVSSAGVIGVAYATLIATTAEMLAAIPYAMRVNRVGPAELLTRALAPALVATVPALALALELRSALELGSLVAIGLAAIPPLLVFAVVFLLMPQSRVELRFVRRVAVAASRRLSAR